MTSLTMACTVFEDMLKKTKTLVVKKRITRSIKHEHDTMRDFIKSTLPEKPTQKNTTKLYVI